MPDEGRLVYICTIGRNLAVTERQRARPLFQLETLADFPRLATASLRPLRNVLHGATRGGLVLH